MKAGASLASIALRWEWRARRETQPRAREIVADEPRRLVFCLSQTVVYRLAARATGAARLRRHATARHRRRPSFDSLTSDVAAAGCRRHLRRRPSHRHPRALASRRPALWRRRGPLAPCPTTSRTSPSASPRWRASSAATQAIETGGRWRRRPRPCSRRPRRLPAVAPAAASASEGRLGAARRALRSAASSSARAAQRATGSSRARSAAAPAPSAAAAARRPPAWRRPLLHRRGRGRRGGQRRGGAVPAGLLSRSRVDTDRAADEAELAARPAGGDVGGGGGAPAPPPDFFASVRLRVAVGRRAAPGALRPSRLDARPRGPHPPRAHRRRRRRVCDRGAPRRVDRQGAGRAARRRRRRPLAERRRRDPPLAPRRDGDGGDRRPAAHRSKRRRCPSR